MDNSQIVVFGYGSNMSSRRILQRCPSFCFMSIGHIVGYKLRFNKKSKDGSGKANIAQTGNPNDIVWGVVFEINYEDKYELDKVEGKGHGYNETIIKVEFDSGKSINAIV